MRLLSLVVLAGIASAVVVRAQSVPTTGAEVRVGHYRDTDATTVWRPYASAQAGLETWQADAYWTLDAVSSASIDVVTRASQAVRDYRHELGAGVAFFGEEGSLLRARYTHAWERDYETHALALTAGRDLDRERLWHLQAALSADRSTVGAVRDPRFQELAHGLRANLSLARILSARAVVRFTLEAGGTWGYQASPYRTVRLGNWVGEPYTGTDPDAGAWVFSGVSGVARETHPERRRRVKAGATAVVDLGVNLASWSQLGTYADSWGVRAAEGQTELRWEPTDRVLLRTGGRVYLQRGAKFWQSRYTSTNAASGYVSDDKELGALRSYSVLGATRLRWESVSLDLRCEWTRYHYPRFTLLRRKDALATQIGLRWTR